MVAATALSLLLPASAPFGPVCGLPQVLQVVSEQLADRGIQAELDGRSVGERSAPGEAVTLCSVKVLLRGYNTDAYGYAPTYRMEVRGYEVRRMPNSFLVKLLD